MEAIAESIGTAPAQNVVRLPVTPKPRLKKKEGTQPFRVIEFTNPRTGTASWRVAGWKRDGTRIRENFSEEVRANARMVELTTEWLQKHSDTAVRATTMSEVQVRIAESAFLRLDNDADMLSAIELWLSTRHQRLETIEKRLDDAFEDFKTWLKNPPKDEPLSHATKKNLQNRVNVFVNSVKNVAVGAVTKQMITDYLSGRNVSKQTKTNDRLALSRFFVWCLGRKFTDNNPARKDTKSPRPARNPQVLTVEDAERLMRCAEKFKKGRMVPFLAVCLFGGLRPMMEARRLTWERVNFVDNELTVVSTNPRKRGRTVKMIPALRAWLERYKDKMSFNPSNFRKDFDALRLAAGFGEPDEKDEARKNLKPWVEDFMRHTAISHYFRNCGSYGLTAEWAGNSEQVIKNHYQGKVSTDDTKRFYAIMPKKSRR